MKKIFIVSLHYTKPLEEIDKHVVAHRAYLDIGFEKGILIGSGRKNPPDGGVIISCLQDKQTLMDFLNHDPFAINNLVEHQIIEFTPNKFCPEFKQILDRISE